MLSSLHRLFLSFWVPIALLFLWWVSSFFVWVNPYLLPSPGDVFRAFLELIKSGELFEHIFASIGRSFGGYFFAACIALPLAYLFAKNEKIHLQSHLILESLRMIPPLSLAF